MLDSVTSSRSNTLPVTSLVRARYGLGKLSLPVSGAMGYARLKHIQGVPPLAGDSGFSIQKLQAIDSLIDRLAQLKNVDRFTEADDGASAQDVDALIQRYSAELHSAIAQMSASGYVAEADLVGTILNGEV